MCLPNFFGNLQKSKVKSQILSTVENVPKIYWTFLVLNFAKMYQNFQKLTVYVKNRRSLYQKFWKLMVYVKNGWLFLKFLPWPVHSVYKMEQIGPKWLIKMVKNPKKFTGIFDLCQILGLSTLTKNAPECTAKNVPVFPVHCH